LPQLDEGKVGVDRNRKLYFCSYELLMEVVEGDKLVKLFAPAVKKERSEVAETKKLFWRL
jgi:hypothetical protein